MVIHTDKIRRLRIAEETTFGADLTGTIASFLAVSHTSATVSITQPRVSPNTMQQIMDSSPLDVLTEQKRATATITCNLTGQTFRSGNGEEGAHTQTVQGMLLRSFFGGQRLGQGDLIAAGSSTNILNVDVGSRWENGAGIAYALTSGRLRTRHLYSKSTNAMTCYPDMDDLPSDGATAYGAATYYYGPSAQNDSGNKTIQLIAEGLVTTDRYLLLGGKVTGVSFTFARGSIATVQYTIQFVDWIYGEAAATNLTSDTAPLAYVAETANGSPLTVHDSDLIWEEEFPSGNSNTLHASDVTIGCEAAWVPVPSTTGVNGVIGWASNHSPGNVTASFSTPYESRKWEDYRDEPGVPSTGLLHFQVGSDVTQGACLFALRAQVREVARVEVDGLAYQRVSLVGGVPISTDVTDAADSPLHVHMF